MFYKQCKALRLDCPSSFFDGQIVKSDATVNGKRPQMGRPVAPSSSFLWWCRFLCRFFAEGQTIKGKAKTRSPLRDNGFHWSCWADSNRRPHPYQGCALPTELQQHIYLFLSAFAVINMAGAEGFEPSARGFGDRCSTS